jgi:hypothetical protein
MKRNETKRYSTETETKRNETIFLWNGNETKRNNPETKRNETKIKIKRFGKKKLLTLCSDLIILFLCTSPVAIENISAQVHDVDIFTALWAQFTFWQPKKAFFIRLPPAKIIFFRQKNMIWHIFCFSMKLCKKIHNLGNESVVINQYATCKKAPSVHYYEITVKKPVWKFCELKLVSRV